MFLPIVGSSFIAAFFLMIILLLRKGRPNGPRAAQSPPEEVPQGPSDGLKAFFNDVDAAEQRQLREEWIRDGEIVLTPKSKGQP